VRLGRGWFGLIW